MISADVICDTLNPSGNRLTTFVLVFPRIVLAEFNTHRMFSRNSASSRAIPFKKMVDMVLENPFIPHKFQKDHSGMQGTEYLSDVTEEYARKRWLLARDSAVHMARCLNEESGVTKQLCNRLLEPFMYHKVICTGTDFANFFALRAHPEAEIHIAELAHKMLEAYNKSTPAQRKAGEWHIPFGDQFDDKRLDTVVYRLADKQFLDFETAKQSFKIKIASARCARISYNNFEGKDDYYADIKLYERLASSGHWSPMEHCARVDTGALMCGNFRGFTQVRKLNDNENIRNDSRIIPKGY